MRRARRHGQRARPSHHFTSTRTPRSGVQAKAHQKPNPNPRRTARRQRVTQAHDLAVALSPQWLATPDT